jgi:uncharacterized protein (TIGR02246 family)
MTPMTATRRAPSSSRPADERAILELTRHLAESWNRHDADAYASVFSDNSDYIAFDGTHLEGRNANARHHARLFESVLRGSRIVFEDVAIKFLTTDVAVMHGMGSVLLPWQRAVTPGRRSLQTYVVVRQDGTWRIAAFHNVRVRPMRLPTGLGLRLIVLAMHARTVLAGRRRG